MKVSVLVTTYNHEKFIAQAIDSILAQKVTFDYEIVIGEDGSTDTTRDIALTFRRRYPKRIRLLLPQRNLGFYGNIIFEQALEACRGQYIALLEGDDYWTSPYKLQRQVDYLEAHPECAVCFHKVAQIWEDGSSGDWDYTPPNKKEISSLEDLLSRNFIGTCSAVFRKGLYGELPDSFHKVALSDWLLHILNAQYGKIGYIDEVMGVYRIHSGGLWSSRTYTHMLESEIQFYRYIDACLNFRYSEIIRAEVSKRYHKLVMSQKPAELEAQLEQQREDSNYRRLVGRIREVVRTTLPPDATVIVVSKGDDDLLELDGRQGWHFPRAEGGGPKKLFAEGSSGSEEASWIENGKTYEFLLYAGTERETLLASIKVTRSDEAFVTASPNPVPADLGKTTIGWSTGQESSWGQVYVSAEGGGPEMLFAGGAKGSQEAPWIQPNATHEFRLYAGKEHKVLLDSVEVKRSEEAFITANPNPVLAGEVLGETTINWSTGNEGEWGQVYVSVAGGEAGYYPSDSAAAIAQLEELREKRADFLLFPNTAMWWLEHYPQFKRHLEKRYREVVRQEDTCLVYALHEPKKPTSKEK